MIKSTYSKNQGHRTVAFIIARLNSSRLKAKQFRTIGDRPLIEWVTQTLKQCKELDEIVLATVAMEENKPLRQFALENNIACFWYKGEVDHLTTRLRNAAEAYKADIGVVICCDSPLIHAPGIDESVRQLKSDPESDYIMAKNDESGQSSAMNGIFVCRKKAWQLADDMSDRPELKEHVFPIMFQHTDIFKCKKCILPMDIYCPNPRFSVDTWADLQFMNTVYNELEKQNKRFNLPNVVELLKKKPKLRKINAHVHQRRVVENLKKVLFAVDTIPGCSVDSFKQDLQLALQIIERLSWPVTFLVDDEKTAQLIEHHGLRVVWGAWGRRHTPSPGKGHRKLWQYKDLSGYHLVLLDICHTRNLQNDWHKSILESCPVIVFNRTEPWALKADAVIQHGKNIEHTIKWLKEFIK